MILCVPTRGEGDYREVLANGKINIDAETKEIKETDAILAALVKSNAETTIKIGETSMKIVAAMDFSKALPERKALTLPATLTFTVTQRKFISPICW